jgi:hypothetical protein
LDATQLIVELAGQIEAQQAAHQFWYWVTVAAVSFLFGAAGSFVSEYFKKRGETKAIQADLEMIKTQQRELTSAVKKVEFELGHEDWKKRELTTLRRQKLEDLLVAAGECADWAIQSANHILGRGPESRKTDPMPVAKLLALAFFPGLVIETFRLYLCQSTLLQTARREQIRRLTMAEAAVDKKPPPVDAVVDQHVQLLHRLLLEQANMVVTEGAVIMRNLLGAEPTPRLYLTSIRDDAVMKVREFSKAHGLENEEEQLLHSFDERASATAEAIAKLR